MVVRKQTLRTSHFVCLQVLKHQIRKGHLVQQSMWTMHGVRKQTLRTSHFVCLQVLKHQVQKGHLAQQAMWAVRGVRSRALRTSLSIQVVDPRPSVVNCASHSVVGHPSRRTRYATGASMYATLSTTSISRYVGNSI